jgi:DNA helicase-2/ATP-dependent DNA helicase PcrA
MDSALYETLVTWRLEESKRRSVPAYVVFTDATLQAIAEQRPASEAELLRVSGVGARKLEMYGEALLALLRQ